MDVRFWILLACIAGVAIAVAWWKRRARRAFTIDHIRVELHDAHIVDDRVIEASWRAAISMKYVSRRPRQLPVFAERATVRSGRRTYLATVYLDAVAGEVNPGDVALAWVEFVLPAERQPGHCRVQELRTARPPRVWQLVCDAVAHAEVGERQPTTRTRSGATAQRRPA